MFAPLLTTPRLILRAHRVDDFDACAALWGSADVTRFIGGSPRPPQDAWFRILRYAGQWQLLGWGFWAVTDRASGEFLGEGGFGDFRRGLAVLEGVPEIGWAFAPAAWGKGIASEAVAAMLAWGDAHLAARETRCMIDLTNHASRRVAEKCGFVALDTIEASVPDARFFSRRG